MYARRARKNVIGTALLVALLGLAGCGGSDDDAGGIATAGESTASAPAGASGPPPAADEAERQRQYLACLRSHGVQVADPERGKQVELNEDRPQDKQAAQACRQYLPTNANAGKGDIGALREYSACMREKGLADFPDPDPERGLQLPKTLLNDPAFKAADQECGQGVKSGGGGS
ncbi:hypothetical protein [Plantactinospora sp. CA-290183]|uniref:hypothetical protein n=1 Tax=Plantactinospora sp. CA-290183 TaxID=3240006 RepID=UPI003D8DE737